MKGLGGGKVRVWITDGTTGAAIYEDQYRAKGFSPPFRYLPSKTKYDTTRSVPILKGLKGRRDPGVISAVVGKTGTSEAAGDGSRHRSEPQARAK